MTVLRWLGRGATLGLSLALHGAASLLAPFGLGRMLRRVSIPRMQQHRLRTVLTLLGVALGVAVLVSVVTVSRSIVIGVTRTIDDLAGKADLQLVSDAGGFDESVLDKVRDVPGIYKSTPVLQQLVTLHGPGRSRERVLLLGVDLLGSDDPYFRDYASSELEAIKRDPLPFLNGKNHLILSRPLAQRAGVRLHDRVEIDSGHGVQPFEVWGLIENEGVGRAFGGAVAIMYYPALQVAFERGRMLDRVDLAVEPGADAGRVAQQLTAALGPGFRVERPAIRGERIDKMLGLVRTALTMSSLIALLAGASLAFNTISISIVQRRRELGILRALGMTRGQLVHLLTLEGALIGLVGSALGIGLGVAMAGGMLRMTSRAVSEVYMEHAANEVQLDGRVIGLGFVLGLATTIFAAWLATRRAAGVRPIDAFRGASLQRKQPPGHLARTELAALIFLVCSALLPWLPPLGNLPIGALAACLTMNLSALFWMPRLVRGAHAVLQPVTTRYLSRAASLASANLPRDLSRTASTAAGLMAAAALSIASATFTVSFVRSLDTWSGQIVPGDLFVTSGAAVGGLSQRNTPVAAALGDELRAIPGVARIRPTRFIDIDFRGSPVKLVSTDSAELVKRSSLTVLEGDMAEISAGWARGAVTVSENFSRLFAVHRGDRIELPTAAGLRPFEVVGVLLDYTSDRGTISLDRSTFITAWNDSRVDTFELHLARAADAEQVRTLINERMGKRHDLFVLTNREFRDEFVKAADHIFALMHVLELVTLLVAAFGMVSSVLANVLDRVREIGVLRAVGMLQAQVRKMVVIEATLTGLIGTVAGIALGLSIGYVMLRFIASVQIGWYLVYHLPTRSIAELVAVALPVSALAGYWPARQAATLNVSEALDYE